MNIFVQSVNYFIPGFVLLPEVHEDPGGGNDEAVQQHHLRGTQKFVDFSCRDSCKLYSRFEVIVKSADYCRVPKNCN
jgi:hypothetical protein